MRLDIERLKRINAIFMKDKSHAFMSHELLVPFANKTSAPRVGMWSKQILQVLDPVNPQPPRVASGYEREIGKYSTSYTQMDRDYKVIKKIVKYPNLPDMKYILVLQDKSGRSHVVERENVGKLSQKYCYPKNNTVIDSKQVGSIMREGEIIAKSNSYDNYMNFMQGRNGRTAYIGALGTFEDAMVLRKKWAKGYTTLHHNAVSASCNTNELFTNIYGDINSHKFCPDIGEKIANNKLLAIRKINTKNMYFDLSKQNMMKINYNSDDVKIASGTVVDIDIYCNSSMETIEKTENHQLIYYYKNQQRYYTEIKKTLGKIIKRNPLGYTDELSRMYDRAYELTSGKKITVDKSEFENLHLVFHIVEEHSIHEGSKLAGRYGDKGVVSVVWDDEYMPKDEYGNPMDVILSMIGPINRLNGGQFDEHFLGFYNENVVRVISKMTSIKQQTKYILNYLRLASPNDYKVLKDMWNKSTALEIQEDIRDTIENGLHITQAPFWDNLSFLDAMRLQQSYKFPRYNCTYNNGIKMNKPIMIGDRYWYCLKHTPKSKVSARSTGMLNQLNMPDKSKDFKKNRLLMSNTPQRQGEMENMALLMGNDVLPIVHMNRTYASDPRDREKLNRETIGGDPFNMDVNINFERQTAGNMVLSAQFKGMGHKLIKGRNKQKPLPKELKQHFRDLGI